MLSLCDILNSIHDGRFLLEAGSLIAADNGLYAEQPTKLRMKVVARVATGIVVVAVVFGVYLLAVSTTPQFIAKQARGLRKKDVENLTHAYVSLGGYSSKVTNIDLLIERLAKEGITIHNPIPIDRSLPSYRIGVPPIHLGALIEETDNVRDDTIRVWSAADGTVITGLKNERLAKDMYPFPTNPPPPWRPTTPP